MKVALAANIMASNIMASLIVLIAGISAGFAQEADASLNAFFKQYLEETFKFRPLDATRLGDHRFDDLLDDISLQARKTWIEHSRKTLEELPKQVDYEKLSRDGKIDFEIFQLHLKSSIWNAENIRPFELDPRTYNAYINDSVYVPLTQSTLPKETNISNSIARMKLIPQVIAEAKRSLQNPPAVVTETAVKQNLGSIGFYERDIFQIVGETPQMDALKAAAKPVVEGLKRYQQFLEKDLLPRAHGEWRLGREKFGEKLRLDLEAEVTPEQVLAEAESEFARVERDMYMVARQLWSRYFPKQALPPDDAGGVDFASKRCWARLVWNTACRRILCRTPGLTLRASKNSLPSETFCACPSRTIARWWRCRNSSAAIPRPIASRRRPWTPRRQVSSRSVLRPRIGTPIAWKRCWKNTTRT